MSFAAAVLAVVLWIAIRGFRQRSRWNGALTALRGVGYDLEALFGSRGHRDLYHSYAAVCEALGAAAKRHPAARWVLDDLLPAVDPYHHRAAGGTGGAWDEIRNAFLERRRHIVRLTRAAASWVVLIGLAGTVFGFMEAMPALREVLAASETAATAPLPAQADPAQPPATDAPGEDEAAAVAGRKLYRVLGSLQGVFVATFAGVLGALLLSGFNLLFFEPAFDRFAESVDRFGARWLDPLVRAPDNLIDEALRSELRIYFAEIARGLGNDLKPLVSNLCTSLEEMFGLTTSFSGNIREGTETLKTFHEAVHELGSSAAGAVGQVGQIVEITGKFVQEVGDLQHKGVERLSEALAGPASALAGSATAMQGRVESLHTEISSLAQAIDRHSGGEEALRQSLARTAATLEEQMQATTELHGAMATLVREQGHLAGDSRSTLVAVAAGVGTIRDLLGEIQALGSPERLREERQGLEALRRAVETLRDGMARLEKPGQGLARNEASPSRESQEQVRLLREIRALLQRSVEESAAARESWLKRILHRDEDGQGASRLLRWLGIGRGAGE